MHEKSVLGEGGFAGLPTVYVILVNWNAAENTAACLDSLLRCDYANFRIVICDNGSTDGSLDRLVDWAQAKQCNTVRYKRKQAEAGGDRSVSPKLCMIEVGANVGFAGGNNIGLRYALARGDMDYAWLLNNDTEVDKRALTALVGRLIRQPDAGCCGSTLVFHAQRDRVQAFGGASYSKWRGVAHPVGQREPVRIPDTREAELIERRLDYIIGASMLVSKEFINSVGLMCEDYFLYFEELDWAMRARGHFALAYAPDSVVWHKVGASTGRTDAIGERAMRLYYRNRLRFGARFFPHYLLCQRAAMLVEVIEAILKGRFRQAMIILEAILGGDTDNASGTPANDGTGALRP